MSIRERSGRWYYRFKIGGRQYEKTTGLEATRPQLNAAKALEAQARLEVLQGLKPRAKEITFQIAATEFLRWCHGTQYRRKPNTAKRISGSFSSLTPFLGDMPVAAISPGDIERYKTLRCTEHHVKDVTLRNDLNALSLFFRYAIRSNWRTTNPLLGEDKVARPSGEDAVRMYILTPEEEEAYFAACGARHNCHDLAKLILLQGCRPEEILSLEKSDYYPSKGTIQIRHGKTKAARRELTLCGESVEILERRKKLDSKWLFPSLHKKRFGDFHIRQMDHTHASVMEDAALPWFVLYDFRHTFATRMAQAGVDLASLAAILGHSSLRLVMKYVHPTAEHQKSAMKKYEASRPSPKLKKIK